MEKLLCTPHLINSGIVDFVWNSALQDGTPGWREPSMENFSIHSHAKDAGPVMCLPQYAVLMAYIRDFKDAINYLNNCYSGGKYILILREGDENFPDNFALPRFIKYVFSINVLNKIDNIFPMPMAFHMHDSYQQHIEKTLLEEKIIKNKVFACFSLDAGGRTRKEGHDRVQCIKNLKDKSFVTMPEKLRNIEQANCPLDPPEYFKEVYNHIYSATPIGYGVERIAYWEAMALKTIPICKKYPQLMHFTDMPIAFIDDWSEVTESWCDQNVNLINKPVDKIFMPYWIDKIKEMRNQL